MAAGDRWERQARLFEALAPFLPGPPPTPDESSEVEEIPSGTDDPTASLWTRLRHFLSGLSYVDVLSEAARTVLERLREGTDLIEGPEVVTALTEIPNPYQQTITLKSDSDVSVVVSWDATRFRVMAVSHDTLDRDIIVLIEQADGTMVAVARVRPEDLGKQLEAPRMNSFEFGVGGWNLRVIEVGDEG
jgi:hypothetical protein